MLNIDETHITSLERDELGTWTAEAHYGDTTLNYSWDPSTQEERDDDRRLAVLSTLDNLRVCAVRDMIGDGKEHELDDEDLRETILAADRIGDDEIGGIVLEAWRCGVFLLKQPPAPIAPVKPLTFAEAVDAERLDEIENDRIETDIREILGELGCVTPLRSIETDEIIGWSVCDGAVTIEREDLPVCAGKVEGDMTRYHRRSLLMTMLEAYTAGMAATTERLRSAITERRTA